MAINKTIKFTELDEFWNYACSESNARIKESRTDDNFNWKGGLTWEEAKSMARSGWPEGMRKIEKFRAQIIPIITERVVRQKQIHSIAGSVVDVGAYLSNDPECFITREPDEQQNIGRIIKIVCSVSFSAAIKPETIIQRGALVCALADAIEFAGYRVEISCNGALSINHHEEHRLGKRKDHGWLEFDVLLKKSNQQMEMTDLAFCLAHPSMLRRILFSAAELEGWSNFTSCYGYPAEPSVKGDVNIGEIFSGTVSDEQAINWVLNELEKLGIEITNK